MMDAIYSVLTLAVLLSGGIWIGDMLIRREQKDK